MKVGSTVKRTVKGRARVVGANVDTDQIYPGRYLELTDPNKIAAHIMEGVDPNFSSTLVSGDIVVAGRNFGCGSSREHAAIALKHAKVGAVVAESFARIFFRNAINLGIPLMVVPGIAKETSCGDQIEVDFSKGEVHNFTNKKTYRGEPLAEHLIKIMAHGGIKSLLRKQLTES